MTSSGSPGSTSLRTDDGCEIRLRSELGPDSRVLRVVAATARPLVNFGHNWVLDTGAQQFAEHAAGRRSLTVVAGHGAAQKNVRIPPTTVSSSSTS